MQGKKPLNIAIGRRIQQSREQAGLTQEELASGLTVPRSSSPQSSGGWPAPLWKL